MTTVRVLHLVPGYAPATSFGGPIESTHRLCQALVEQGVEVRVLTTDLVGPGDRIPYPRDRWVEHEGVLVRYCASWGRLHVAPSYLAALPAALREAEVVHVTGVFNFTVLPSLAACLAYGKPFVHSARGSLEPWALAQKAWKKRPVLRLIRPLIDRAAALHATSAHEADALRALGLTPPIRVIPNGVSLADGRLADRTKRIWRARLGLGDAPVLLMLGRIHPVKGIDIALAALADIRRQFPTARLILAGPDDEGYGAEVRALMSRLGLDGAVHLVGMVQGEAKFQLLAEADLLLLPSRQESFGNVVVEALSVGTPVVASRATPWEALEAEGCGRRVDLDAAALVEAVSALLAKPTERANMGGRGRAVVAREYAWDVIAGAIFRTYRASIAGKASRGRRAWVARPRPLDP